MDGEVMLLHQGAAAFTLWTGVEAPLEVMANALAAARAGGLRSAEGEPAGPEVGDPSVTEAAPTEGAPVETAPVEAAPAETTTTEAAPSG
jgi:hypothetical protein